MITPPDFDAIAKDLKSKGYTYEQIEQEGSSLLKSAPDVVLEDPEGSRPSDEEFVLPEGKETGTPKSIQKLLASFESLEAEEAVAVEGESFNGGLFEQEAPINFQDVFGVSKIIDTSMNKLGASEMSLMLSSVLDKPRDLLEEELSKGDTTSISEATSAVNGVNKEAEREELEMAIKDAPTPEYLAEFLKKKANEEARPTSMLDLRRNYIVNELKPPSNRVRSLSREIERDAVRSTELAKLQAKVWEETSLLGVLGDFTEIVLPTGVISEEYDKFNNGLEEGLERIRKAPIDKQEEVFNELVDTWLATETFLIQNNNSVLLADQLAGLEQAIRDGGLGLIRSGGTAAEFEDDLETFINTTVFAYEFKAVGKGVKGLMKFLSHRIFPSNKDLLLPEERIPYTPFTEARNTLLVEQPNTVKIVEGVVDVRKGLAKAASQKDTRKVRMTLESEKKQLGKLEDEINNTNLNAEARALANKLKIKFKDALKRVNKEKEEQINAIARRKADVQDMINDFDKAATAESKLSRLNQHVKDGRATDKDLFEPSGEHKVELAYDTREGVSAYDKVAKEHIADFYKRMKEKGLQDTAQDVGLSPEAMAARLIATPSETTDLGYPNISDAVNELVLVDEDMLKSGEKRAKALARSTGGSLKIQDSGVSIVNNTDERSMGDFKFLFGDGDEGFESASDAREAMEQGLVGVDKKRVVERNNKWYIEVEQKHTYDPRYDSKDLYVDFDKISNKSSLLLDPLRRLGEEVLRGVSALKMYNRSYAQKMQDELEAIFTKDKGLLARAGLRPMDSKDVNGLMKALNHTDKDDVDWISNVDEFAEIVGMDAEEAQNIWKRYQRIQKVMDDIYQIRNEKYRKSLLSRNVKDVKFGEDTQRGAVVLKPHTDEIYDPIAKRNVRLDDMGESQVVIRLEEAILDEAGDYRRLVVANKADVKELPPRVLNQRKGHIDRFYRDAGWTVKVPRVRIVDGVEEKSSSTTHIVKSQKEADKIVEKIKREEGVDAVAMRARENDELDGIYGDESSVQYGYAGSHTKGRGNILKGSDGVSEAETLNVLESIARSVGGVEKQLDVDIVNSLRTRFLNQFKDYLVNKGGTSYSGRYEDMFDRSRIPKEVAEKAEQWHQFIENISRVQQGKAFQWIDKQVRQLTTLGIDSQAISSSLQKFATEMVIVGRPVFQVIQNTTQLLYIAQAYPIETAKSAYRLLPTLLAMSRPSGNNIKRLASVMGTSEELALEFVTEVKKNGLWDAVGMSDDFLRMVQKNSIDAKSTKIGNSISMGKNALMSPFAVSKAAQESVIKIANLMAYMSEFEKQVLKGGRRFDAKTKADMSFNTQKITQTQTSLNQFDYQSKSSLMSPMFQFTQHVHKLYLDVVADPVLKLTKDPILKALGKEVPERVSPLAKTHLQAVGSLLTTYAIFGPQGIFGGILGGKIEDEINNIKDPVFKATLQGNLMNHVVNSTVNYLGFEGNVDFSSKMHPASVIDTLYDYHIEKFASEGTLSITGAAGYVAGMVYDTGKAIGAIAGTEGIDWMEEGTAIATDVLSTVAGISDYQRAYMSYHLGNFTYKSSLSGNLPVTAYEAIAQVGNFPPAAIQDRWSEFTSTGAQNDDAVKALGKVFSRMMHREFAEVDKTDRAEALSKMLLIANKYSVIATNSVDPMSRGDMVKTLSRYVSPESNKSYFDYIKPYIEQKDLNDMIPELISLKEDASTDAMREEIDKKIATLQLMIPTIEEAYVK